MIDGHISKFARMEQQIFRVAEEARKNCELRFRLRHGHK